MLLAFAMYFLPSVIGARRKHPSKWAIFVVNLFFGWTFFGWVIALVWACSSTGVAVTVYNTGPGTVPATHCYSCNQPLRPSARFCGRCGTRI